MENLDLGGFDNGGCFVFLPAIIGVPLFAILLIVWLAEPNEWESKCGRPEPKIGETVFVNGVPAVVVGVSGKFEQVDLSLAGEKALAVPCDQLTAAPPSGPERP